MSISSANPQFLTPNQLNNMASSGALQPGQTVLIPASMIQSGQIDTTEFQPIGYSPSGQSGPIMGYNPGGPEIPYYGQQGGQNPFNNGLPVGPGPVMPGGSPILGGQTEPGLPSSTGIPSAPGQGQSSSFIPFIAQMMQMMITLLSQMMQMMGAGAASGDGTNNNNNNNANNNNQNNGGHHGCGGH